MKSKAVTGLPRPVSEIILGLTWANAERQDIFDEIVDAYIEAGGTLLDAGRFYGKNGECEVCLRRWLEDNPRDKIMLTDKCCHPFTKRDGIISENSRWRVSDEFITEDLEFSLDRVGTEYFDLYLLHRDDENVPVSELMDRLEVHRREGRIKAYGVSNWQIQRVKEATDYCADRGYQGLSAVSVSYSLATVSRPRWRGCVFIGDETARLYTEMGIPLFSYSSQGAGFFSQRPDRLALKDLNDSYCSEINYDKLNRANELAQKLGCSATNIALAYILSQGLNLFAIIGPRSADDLLDSIRASGIRLSEGEIEYLSLRADGNI